MDHSYFMKRCLELASQGRGVDGALVGAVLVRDGQIISEGFYDGGDHAERIAITLRQAQGKKIGLTEGLYVNLEPCCHTGKTPPCTDFIIESGIKHVIYGMVDPDPRVSGKGIEILRSAGVQVEGAILRSQCERLNRGFISLRTKGRPYITLKKAQTSDGKVANDDGSTLPITSGEQNSWSHQFLRGKHDAILVGVQTVIADDPLLTNRNERGEMREEKYQPVKIILDPQLRIPRDSKVITDRTIIITSKDPEPVGDAQVIQIPIVDGHFDWEELWKSLNTQHSTLNTILVEGGPKTWNAFKEANLVDEEVVLVG